MAGSKSVYRKRMQSGWGRRLFIAVGAATLAWSATAPAQAADNYSNKDYRTHDLDNVSRSIVSGRQLAYLGDVNYGKAFTPTAAESFLINLGRQVADLQRGRYYLTLGQLLPGGQVGDPTKYHEMTPTIVSFVSRTGAKLVGRIWSDGADGPHPAVVITPGSIQGTQSMYWWAARTLAKAGYQVLTFDVQGQSESETFGHKPGKNYSTTDGFPFQQQPNFVDGTVDAIRFLYARPGDPYVPGGWTPAQVAAQRAAGDMSLNWVNPQAAQLDRTRLALAGHSAGAGAISKVQQCSDASDVWKTLATCLGRSYPIKAIVAWDGLASRGVVPVVPAMNQQADGYFLNPQPSYAAPDPTSHLSSMNLWRSKGVDSYSLTVRGGTHMEWVDVPYILPSTTYGVRMVDHYTLAWIDRYMSPDAKVRADASAELLNAPRRAAGNGAQQPWRADFMSARYAGGFAFHTTDGQLRLSYDLRAYGGASKVGDWAGANANKPKAAS